jgi:Ser/Thr protein kinase RdoA (MazF antagonist)
MDDEARPRTTLKNFSPVFPVRDLRRALAHYAALGFDVTPYDDGDEYGFADRDGVGLHLSAEGDHEHDDGGPEHADDHDHGHEHGHEHGAVAYLYVADADALYAEWAQPGLGGLTRRPFDTDYKLREGAHVDPDGNLIRFGSPLPAQPAQRLRTRLEAACGISVATMTELDLGVWRVGRADGPDWVARWFPPARPAEAAAGDAEILRFLASRDFPAERLALPAPATPGPDSPGPVPVLDGRPVLLTEWAAPVPRQQRREAVRAAGGLRQLGALLGQLHTLPPGPAAASRPGGAWHHLADGPPSAEIAAAVRLLDTCAHLFAGAEQQAFGQLRSEVAALDSADGLPTAFTHPDFVLANVVATENGMVIVDWAGAGIGPRVWSLAFLLYAEGARDLRRAALVLAGYRRHVNLTDAELDRLAAIMLARPLVLTTWSVCTGRITPSQALTQLAELRPLTETIAARVRAALAS